ncbi:MAG: integrase [Sulfurospirillaceae bacterium]|nr:integrase [Sulfurospirillaceae bacterium]MDD2825392.1 integrase [Sulfurospirillaceae bacterium]
MDKKLTVLEAAKLLGVSKEAIYNRLRRGSLQSVVEDGIKYIVMGKSQIRENSPARKIEVGVDPSYIELLKSQLEEIKLKNIQLEADKERLINDKERLLIESKEKIESIYKERDEQLKIILSLANRQITHQSPEIQTATQPVNPEDETRVSTTPFFYEDADVLDEEEENYVEKNTFESYRDWRDLRSYLKQKGFSKKEKQNISHELEKKVGKDADVIDKNGKLFIKKGKKLKEILGK